MAGVLFIGLPARTWALARVEGLRERLGDPAGPLTAGAASGLAVSLGAFLGALPLVAFNFGDVPLLGGLATLAALLAMPLFLVLAGLTAALGLVVPPLATATGWGAALGGLFLAELAALTASVPGGRVAVDALDVRWVWGAYAVAGAVAAWLLRGAWAPAAAEAVRAAWRGPSTRFEGALLVVALAALAVAPWAYAATASDGLLRLDVLDVGQGDAILVTTPSGGTALIDGGPDPRAALAQIDALLPSGALTLDAAVLTHPHADHMTGLLALARRGRLAQVVAPPPGEDDAWDDELAALGVPVVEAVRGMTLTLADGVRIEALSPLSPPMEGTTSDVNNNGVAARVVYGEASALLTGDLFVEAERALLDLGSAGLRADVLKAGHHGSRTSTSAEFLAAVDPFAAVISVGEENSFGHPSPEVVERLREAVGADRVYSTAERGRVRFSTDGERWWVSTERG